jgi:1,5-anhydro-D-fructose reductase (1,5-anhydro-D-mannitol-forming)
MNSRLGWGIVGTGQIATQQIGPAIEQVPNSVLRHVASRDQDRAPAFATRFGGASATTSYAQMLADPHVDAVYIATPNSMHADQAIAAARAGKHVMCDRPLATSVEDARRVVDACAEAGVGLGVMFQSRCYGGMALVRQLIAENQIGPVVTAHAEISTGRTLLKGWRTDAAYAGVGTLNNLGVHMFDLLGYLLNSEVVEVAAMLSSEPGFVLDTTALALLRFASGALVTVHANQTVFGPRPDLVIYGTQGRIVGTNVTRAGLSGTIAVVRDGGEQTEQPVSSDGAFATTIEQFADAVMHGRDPSPSGVDGLTSVALTQALSQAASERRTVKTNT